MPAWVLALASALAAGAAGACAGCTWYRCVAAQRSRRARIRGDPGSGADAARGFVALRYAADVSRRLALGAMEPASRRLPLGRARMWFAARARRAGLADEVSEEGFAEATVRLAIAGAALGALVGCAFSTELALVGGVGGAVAGASAPMRAVKATARGRAARLERELSEMLEVVALGVRSGLSFDRSLELYAAHFDTAFSRECASAQRAWAMGLMTREEALRDLAGSYDSPLLSRVVAGIVRSLRFGSSLADQLESAAAASRADHRAHVEEKVAKAPVKMMVPTGTLILPAMLLLVLGPVLLELMEGF